MISACIIPNTKLLLLTVPTKHPGSAKESLKAAGFWPLPIHVPKPKTAIIPGIPMCTMNTLTMWSARNTERYINQLQPSTSKTDKKLLRFFKKFWNIKKASASTLETEVIFRYTKSVINAKTAAPDYSDAAVKLLQMCDFWGILPTSTRIGIRLAHVGIQPSFSVS